MRRSHEKAEALLREVDFPQYLIVNQNADFLKKIHKPL